MTAPGNQALMGLAVIPEQDASASLLRGGVRLLREQLVAVTDLEPALALLAPGLETLSKLVLGTVLYETNGRWADAPGRYANFNALSRGGAPSDDASPHQLWTDLTAEITNANPQRFQALDGFPAEWDAAMSDLHALLADSIVSWVDLVVTAWNVGRFGQYPMGLRISDATWPKPKPNVGQVVARVQTTSALSQLKPAPDQMTN